jgi:hypothetical protein
VRVSGLPTAGNGPNSTGGRGSGGSGPSGGSGGTGSSGGTLGDQPPAAAGLGPVAAAVILIGFIGAVIWLATLVSRRRGGLAATVPPHPGEPPSAPPGAASDFDHGPPPEAPQVPSDTPLPPPPPREPEDMDSLMDRMEAEADRSPFFLR